MKKLFLGLVAIAIISVFAVKANNNTSNNTVQMIEADHIVQPTLDQFIPFDDTPDFDNCNQTADRNCVYDVTESGKANIPDQAGYNESDIDTYLSQGWIQANPNSSLALYIE